MGPVIGAVIALVFALLWALVTITRRNQLLIRAGDSQQGREALRQFAAQSLDLQSQDEILEFAGQAATVIFGCRRVVAFQSGAGEGQWDAAVPGGQALPSVPAAARGLFGWFRHNAGIAVTEDLEQARFGAMRSPLRQVMDSYEIDVIVPLVGKGEVMAAIGLSVGRHLTVVDRTLLRLFRLQATAACANVRLHREAAQVFSLAREVDLAGAVELALIPKQMEGSLGDLSWAGHFQAAGDAGSDFFEIYPMQDGRVVVVIGDAVGVGLAGSMVSAVVKSCCDAIFDANPTRIGPAALLGALNRALYRSQNPVNTSAFALIINPATRVVEYGNAGHPFPYHVKSATQRLGVLSGSGPLLGDEVDARYKSHRANCDDGDIFVLFTDGLVETRNPERKPYGDRQLQRLLKQEGWGNPAQVRQLVLGAVAQHRGDAPVTDDIALLVVRFR